MKIGVDLDGTLFQTYERMAYAYKNQTGKELDLTLIADFNKDSTVFKWIQRYFSHSDSVGHAPPYPNAISAIQELTSRHDIYFISARRKCVEELTHEQLALYGFTKNIYITSRPDKAHLCYVLGIEIIIEDEAKMALEMEMYPMKIILLDRPWNQSIRAYERIVRIYDWFDILKIFSWNFDQGGMKK